MATQFGKDMQTSFLKESERIARSLNCNTELEKIVAKENLYTFILTMTKWNLISNNLSKAEEYLKELIQLDPMDSTGYSELGIFYLKKSDYRNSAIYFKKALDLGPPGTGMNAYYYATNQEYLGNEKKLIHYLYKSTELDKLAISPWLDLINYYVKKNNHNKAKMLAKNIYNTAELMEQVDEEENQFLQEIIG
ncbi:MAG: hypothetical protein JO149_05565 [Gammaproteobacteria bacterium]|nr:hypothetical protein [Gammaproteobacteria bacterium]